MNRARLGVGALLLAGLISLAACSSGEARSRVVARFSGPEASPPQDVAPRTFGTVTRAAVPAPDGGRFEMTLPRAPRRLRFSVAQRGTERCAAPVRFTVLARRGRGWTAVYDEDLAPGPAAWRDHDLDLGDSAPDSTRFAFASRIGWVHPEQARLCPGRVEAWWGSVAFLGPEAPPQPSAPAGIVLISLDTLGAMGLSTFGGPPGVSPRLDAWLDEAFSFRRAISQYGHTRPSTASILSAEYPHRHGATPENLLASFDTLVPRIAAAGYWTTAFTEGAYVSASFGFARGFDAYDDGLRGAQTPTRSDAAETFGRAGDWLEQHGSEGRFFLFVHSYEVHIPYTPRDPEARAMARKLSPGVERFFTPDVQLHATLLHSRGVKALSERELAHLAALYEAEVEYLDRVVGRFLQRLETLGLARDTLVVLTSDHGEQFGEGGRVTHGQSLHNRVHHVPLGFRWPGRISPGSTSDPVELIDVMPTVLDLAGIEAPAGLDGVSLAPWLEGDAPAPRPAFSELPTSRWECERLGLPYRCRLDRYAVQTRHFKLERSGVPASEQLFDLDADPGEERDASAEHADELARLRALLDPFVARANRAWANPPPGSPPQLEDHVNEQLEALGYVE